MLPVDLSPIHSSHSRLFQPWRSASCAKTDTGQTTGREVDYLELPAVSNYQELEAHNAFQGIKAQFLSDIKALQRLVRDYVDRKYDNEIDSLYKKLDNPPDHLRNSLFPLYRETRFQIHQLVAQLGNFGETDDQAAHSSTQQNTVSKDYIATLLMIVWKVLIDALRAFIAVLPTSILIWKRLGAGWVQSFSR